MRRKPLPTVEELCKGAKRIAILEGVMNPTNVGAIFRSAAAFRVDGVLLSPECANPLYRRAIRVSMGTVFQILWTYYPQWPDRSALKALGFKTVAMAL
jgi:tRNA G18 (ribose-2'-O)-methylase SpoU